MSLLEFCESVLPIDYRDAQSKQLPHELPEFFRKLDTNNDGLISFSEYMFFCTLLGINYKHIDVAFKMFDLDGSGALDLKEFTNMLQVLRRSTVHNAKSFVDEADYVQMLFKGDPTGKVTKQEFVCFMQSLHDAMLQLEFNRYLPPSPPSPPPLAPNATVVTPSLISAKDFGLTLCGYTANKQLHSCLDRLRAIPDRAPGVSYAEFCQFNRVLDHLDEVDLTLRLFSSSPSEVNKVEFRRAALAVTGEELSNHMLDVLFIVFGSTPDGSLSRKTLLKALRKRTTRGVGHSRRRSLAIGEKVRHCVRIFGEH
eukprot:gnl/Spiro4/12471_TR6584_c0_g1_i1.p1 gnl/Spiro4/12471_TR6584_c0_g1~~gnl/Spiro4/12471_TR6584_c0_g1_i1.p1  ORF type:complete len:311 (+),score=48.52 gnl/Spiro4/12471_TR6584_c0_g1_i1:368-1300(+)